MAAADHPPLVLAVLDSAAELADAVHEALVSIEDPGALADALGSYRAAAYALEGERERVPSPDHPSMREP